MENKIDGSKAPLPRKRKRSKSREGDIYYFNSETSQSEQQSPCESHYKQLVMEAKSSNELKNIKPKTKSLLNYQISITNDSNSKFKETENALNIETLRNKTAEILSRPNNPELEIDFRATCSNYQTNSNLHDPLLMQAYQDYLQAYQQKTSLHIINWDIDEQGTEIEIYNTETETNEYKILKTPRRLDTVTCITLLPNGKLFCFGNRSYSGIAVLIDVNGVGELLPSGICSACSSCIYFNNSIYCFGGLYRNSLTLSNRFDLDRKRWIQLTPMPKTDTWCNSIIFNRNILICGYYYKNILLYSIDIDSFSTISYNFVGCRRKILINVERLYLFEIPGLIHESEIGSYTNWKRIGTSTYNDLKGHACCSYNKGGIYIGLSEIYRATYYKFDLNNKLIIRL